MKKVLSIDGGGIRGLIPALVLANIERRTGERVANMFDLVAGTSTGGILACMLTGTNMTANEIAYLYEDEGPNIFSSTIFHKIGAGFGLLGPKYNGKGLTEVLRAYLHNTQLFNCNPRIVVTAYDIERREPYLFKSDRGPGQRIENWPLWQVALATASAPTYFPPAKLQRNLADYLSLIDGGVYAVNPSMIALVEAQKLWPGEEIMLVSLGTGQLTRSLPIDQAKGWGLASWAQPLLNVMFDGQSDIADYHVSKILGRNYYRIQCVLDQASDDMDDASPENLRLLRIQAEELIRNNASAMDELCKNLKSGGSIV